MATECAKLPNGVIDQQKYRHILRTANIVFAPVKVLQNLSWYVLESYTFRIRFYQIILIHQNFSITLFAP